MTIFATFASPDGARSDDDRPDAGLVLLVGDRIDEVLPEWWGANQQLAGWNNPLMNAHAIQAAFDAAHRHRLRPLRDPSTGRVARESSGGIALRQMPPIPIVMVNRYDISHEVSLGMTRPEAAGAIDPMHPVNTAGFMLRGERSVGTLGGGAATLFGHVEWAWGALLAIRGPTGFTVRDVTLNGGFSATRCLEVGHLDESHTPSSFENCGFVQAESALVELEGAATVGRTPALLSFRRCRFDTMSENEAFARNYRHQPEGEQLVGVNMDTRDRVIVEFHGCFFYGAADPFVMARSGWFTLQECTMHVLRLWDARWHDDASQDTTIATEINDERRTLNGTDIYIAPPSVDYVQRGDSASVRARAYEAASFTAKELESQSWQLLATYELTPNRPLMRTSTILLNFNANLSANVPEGPLSAQLDRWLRLKDQPSIYWAGPRRTGSDLIIMGGTFTAWQLPGTRNGRDTGPYKGYVHVFPGRVAPDAMSSDEAMSDRPGRVFDLGTFSRANGRNVFGTKPSTDAVTLRVVPHDASR